MSNINERVGSAAKWSIFTEIIVKIISPITNMILARILVPEEFGVVATVTMIVSFADIFTDAGFQKYVVQHQFKTKEDEDLSINVAFWTNISISLLLWLLIFLFAEQIATVVGNPGMGKVIYIGAAILPMTSFSSIQAAIFRKNLNYKELSFIRIIVKFIPLVVTVPLALMKFSYWALIIGNIAGELCNTLLLTYFSTWKPHLIYRFDKLQEMLHFCMWSLMETISSWLVTNSGIFVLGTLFSQYYLGIYKTGTTMVAQITSLISGATISVLFAGLSHVQHNYDEYKNLYFKFLKMIGILVIPLGAGILMYGDIVRSILLGSKWADADLLIALWGFVLAESVIFNDMSGVVTLSKGQPKLIFFSNMVQAAILIPSLYFAAQYGFTAVVIVSCVVRLQLPIMQTIIASRMSYISIKDIFFELKNYILSTVVMVAFAFISRNYLAEYINVYISIVLCIVIYFGCLYMIPGSRQELAGYVNMIKRRGRK